MSLADPATLRTRVEETGLLWGLVGLVALLSLLPIGRLIVEGLAPGGQLSATALGKVMASPATWTATWNSLTTAIAGTILATLIGGTVALLATLTDIRARNAFTFCFVLPLMIAPQVTALAWLQLFGPSSTLLKLIGMAPPLGSRNPLYSREGIILLLGLQYAPLVFLTLRAGLRALPKELIEAGLAAGASPLTVLRTVVLPLMTPPLVAGIALCFVSSLGNFGIPAFLGIPGNFLVLPTLIYQRLSGLGPGVLSEVAILSLLIGVIAMAGILLQDLMLRRRDFRITTTSSAARPFELGRWRRPVEIGLWAFAILVLAMPFLGLLSTSLIPAFGVPLNAKTATLANYAYVLFEHAASRRAFVNSFLMSAGAATLIVLICVPLGYFIVWKKSRALRLLNLAAELPYAMPGVVLAIAAILLFLKPLPVLNVSLYNTIWIIVFAYLARFLVLGLRPVISGYLQIDRTLEEAAQIAGAGLPRRLVTIIFPLVAPAAVAGALLVFLTAFNELTVSALLWSSGAETLGVVVFSFEQGGDSTYASALAAVTVVVTIGLMASTSLFAQKLPQGVLPWRD
ncbi:MULTISPECIES: iron ABC transporter permease [Bosea]|jgi:iron(III) transport system permease protein|uniref:ABC transporter permease n=1 Tax=Bosea TaxID=85413 RepID=UPI00214FFD32|nr:MULTISPECIES: iron ABC transporter permease [Bosea]MCR4522386.1 iron ABC transporter permease [Bosea sp. 47.2.35]MDR6829145.1 iron(III) transport system permease protein [Bosea robiniae]MDR6896029.1 iron(III) transport system permease protein [Bosea sp. BE109]MDR7139426.1 iron(III) transport system permease protein [Bosea sp. BE168]MDR7176124.1 iron(III) transport system permease protein [Bosea sp. BE271]